MPATKTFENGVASVVFIAGISIKPRHACLGEAAVEAEDSLGTPHRSLVSSGRAEPQDDGRTGSAAASHSFLRSRSPVLLPEHTAASGRRRDQRHDVSAAKGCPPRRQTDDRLVHWPGHPQRSLRCRSRSVLCGQTATNLAMATIAGPVSVSRDSLWWISDRGPIRHLAGGLGSQTVGRHDRLGAAGAVSADPQVRARPGPLTGGRK
jgi:hypothetical protein